MSTELDNIEDPKPEEKKPTAKGANAAGPHEFSAGQTIAVRLTPTAAEALTAISRKKSKLTKSELIEFSIKDTRKRMKSFSFS